MQPVAMPWQSASVSPLSAPELLPEPLLLLLEPVPDDEPLWPDDEPELLLPLELPPDEPDPDPLLLPPLLLLQPTLP